MSKNENSQDVVAEVAPEVQAQEETPEVLLEETAKPPQGLSALNAAYVPAVEDSIVAVRFVGNTAQIGDFQTKAIDAFQLLALGSFLEMKGKQTIAAIEAEAFARAEQARRESAIVVPGRLPTPEELAAMPPGMRPVASS